MPLLMLMFSICDAVEVKPDCRLIVDHLIFRSRQRVATFLEALHPHVKHHTTYQKCLATDERPNAASYVVSILHGHGHRCRTFTYLRQSADAAASARQPYSSMRHSKPKPSQRFKSHNRNAAIDCWVRLSHSCISPDSGYTVSYIGTSYLEHR